MSAAKGTAVTCLLGDNTRQLARAVGQVTEGYGSEEKLQTTCRKLRSGKGSARCLEKGILTVSYS